MIRDVVRIYDQAVFNWTLSVLQAANPEWHAFNSLDKSEPKRFALTFASPERPFSHPSSQDQVRGVRTWPSPFASVRRLTLTFDAEKFNFNRWPAIVPSSGELLYLMSKYPPPFKFPYQVDVRSRYVDSTGGTPTTSSILESISPFYYATHPTVVLSPDFKVPWGIKRVHLFADDIIDNSDLETGEGERWLRFTIPILVEGWMFICADDLTTYPDPFGVITQVPIVKEVIATIANSPSQGQSIGTGDGVTVTFVYVLNSPIRPGSIFISVMGWTLTAMDDYFGNLTGPGIVTGSVNYISGNLSVTFNSAPLSGKTITANYQTESDVDSSTQNTSLLGDNVGY